MEKTIGAYEVRRQFGRVLHDVAAKGNNYIVERHGEPLAAVVPIETYQKWKRDREQALERFFEHLRTAQEGARMSEEEAMALANEAKHASRTQPAK